MRIHLEAIQTTPQPVLASIINEVLPGIGTELTNLQQRQHAQGAVIARTHDMTAESVSLERKMQVDIAVVRANSEYIVQWINHISSFPGGHFPGGHGFHGGFHGRRPPPPPPHRPQEQGQWMWIRNRSTTNNGVTNGATGPSVAPITVPNAPNALPPPRQRLFTLKQYMTAEEVYQDYNTRFAPIVAGTHWASKLGYSVTESKNIRRIGLLVHFAQGRKYRDQDITRNQAAIDIALAELSTEMKRRKVTTPGGIESMLQRLKKAALANTN